MICEKEFYIGLRDVGLSNKVKNKYKLNKNKVYAIIVQIIDIMKKECKKSEYK